jgi:CRP-like cAMP-binding protein
VTNIPACILNIGGASPPCDGERCLNRGRSHDHRVGGLTCRGRDLEPGQHLFVGTDIQSHVYLVKRGTLCLYNMLRNGRRRILSFKFPGDFIVSGFGREHRFSAQAVVPAEIRQFPFAAFHSAVSNNRQILARLYDMVSADLSSAYDLVSIVGQHDAEASVAAFLLALDARVASRGDDNDFVLLPMLRVDIADYLGLTHETVSRVFTSFKRRRLIQLIRGRRVRLENRPALATLAGRMDHDPNRRLAAAANAANLTFDVAGMQQS